MVKVLLRRNACEDARNLCATESPACCTKTCPLSLRQNMTREPCLERHPKHEMSRYKHVRKTSIQAVAPGPLCNCSAFIARSNKCPTFGTTPKHVASCGYVEMQDKVALMFQSDTLASDGSCPFDAHFLKATSCQVVAKTVKGL